LTTHGYRTTVLDPDDPGCADDSVEMHIGEWRRDEFGNRWREVMSEETYADYVRAAGD
jgi:hypothetical protein